MVTAQMLDDMRRTVSALMPETVEIRRAQAASDGLGGRTKTWPKVATVSGLLGAPGDVESPSDHGGPRLGEREVKIPALTDVRVGDRLVIAGANYRVGRIRAPESYEVARRVIVTDDLEA